MQSSPLPSSPPFMSGVCSSIFQSTLPSLTRGSRVSGEAGKAVVQVSGYCGYRAGFVGVSTSGATEQSSRRAETSAP
ncbi:hypothetical protein [Treponema endosymbiont of Eucomonympha sp.]|uniref:hypothetical protein n=1 Tax=Treponema endosymbiont of Eucomonympha sp. TaxID=1580831 RepID=UPI0035A00565